METKRRIQFHNPPYLVADNPDFHEFIQTRSALFDDYPFLLIKQTSEVLKEIREVIPQVETRKLVLSKTQQGGNYFCTLDPKKQYKSFDCSKCFAEGESYDDELFWKIEERKVSYAPDHKLDPMLSKTPFWNLSDIHNNKNSQYNCLNKLNEAKNVPGITTPFAYYGYPMSCFALHREDLDLCSVNYLQQGKPKVWYGFRAKDNDRIEQYLKKSYAEEYSYCEQAFRHKSFLINLLKLQEDFPDLKIFRVVQEPGHFVVTGPAVFHQGYNQGYNIAQAVNFGPPVWKDFLLNASSCYCISSSWKVPRDKLCELSLPPEEVKINSSMYQNVRCSKFLVITEARNYLTVQKQLSRPQLHEKAIILIPDPKKLPCKFSRYSVRVFKSVPIKHSNCSLTEDEVNNAHLVSLKAIHELFPQAIERFTTLSMVYKYNPEPFKLCFILPFKIRGPVPICTSSWMETFHMKWSSLMKICEQNLWSDVIERLPVPTDSSPTEFRTLRKFISLQEIQDTFIASENSESECAFSLALKSQCGGKTEVAVVDNTGTVRLCQSLDCTQLIDFWYRFNSLVCPEDGKKAVIIVPNLLLLKSLLLISQEMENKLSCEELVPGSSCEELHNEAFFKSINVVKNSIKYSQLVKLENIDVSDLARLQFLRRRGKTLSADEVAFMERFCTLPRRKVFILSAHCSEDNKAWKLCLIDEMERVLFIRSSDDWKKGQHDLTKNIIDICQTYLTFRDFLFHDYKSTEDMNILSGNPKLIALDFPGEAAVDAMEVESLGTESIQTILIKKPISQNKNRNSKLPSDDHLVTRTKQFYQHHYQWIQDFIFSKL